MASFEIRSTSRFDRLAGSLDERHPEFGEYLEMVEYILRTDPYNRTGKHHIKKLTDIPTEEGNFRLRLGRWRFRYSIYGQIVVLYRASLRREDTY